MKKEKQFYEWKIFQSMKLQFINKQTKKKNRNIHSNKISYTSSLLLLYIVWCNRKIALKKIVWILPSIKFIAIFIYQCSSNTCLKTRTMYFCLYTFFCNDFKEKKCIQINCMMQWFFLFQLLNVLCVCALRVLRKWISFFDF